tara:strand:+ start:367 stop:732 length:366 start_codon:yes stop_codon:yes gene_type:complete
VYARHCVATPARSKGREVSRRRSRTFDDAGCDQKTRTAAAHVLMASPSKQPVVSTTHLELRPHPRDLHLFPSLDVRDASFVSNVYVSVPPLLRNAFTLPPRIGVGHVRNHLDHNELQRVSR